MSDAVAIADAVTARVAELIGEPCAVIQAWIEPATGVSPRVVRAVYALPHHRVAGLRTWRDEGEGEATDVLGGGVLVALEASKWARLVLKGHGPTLASSQLPGVLAGPLVTELAELAAAVAAGSAAGSFDALDRWLAACRRRGDDADARNAGRGPGR